MKRIRDYRDFLPRDFEIILEKMRKDSRGRFKALGILP